MSTDAVFYTVAFETKQSEPTNIRVMPFLDLIEAFLQKPNNPPSRIINGKIIRSSKFLRDFRHSNIVVIPFGKLKKDSKLYVVEQESFSELTDDLYEIVTMAYDESFGIAMLTKNRQGPSDKDVEDYLNSFCPEGFEPKIRLNPIMHNAGIESIRNAQQIREVEIKLDLGKSLNNFFTTQMDNNGNENRISKILEMLSQSARQDIQSEQMSIHWGFGRDSKHNDSLNLDSLLFLFESLNISSDVVQEINVKYRRGEEVSYDLAKLKNSNILLTHNFRLKGNYISPEYLLNNCVEAFVEKRINYRTAVEQYDQKKVNCTADLDSLNETWNPKDNYG